MAPLVAPPQVQSRIIMREETTMTEGQRAVSLTKVELSTGTILEVKESVEEVDLRLRERWTGRDAPLNLLTLTLRDGRRVKVNAGHVVAIMPRNGAEPMGFHTAPSHAHR
jgi:hypothetical protein